MNTRIFPLIMNKLFIWGPEIMRQMATAQFVSANHCTNCVFNILSYEKWMPTSNLSQTHKPYSHFMNLQPNNPKIPPKTLSQTHVVADSHQKRNLNQKATSYLKQTHSCCQCLQEEVRLWQNSDHIPQNSEKKNLPKSPDHQRPLQHEL